MSRLYDDGGSFQYDAANGKLVSVKFGEKTGGAEFDGKPGSANVIAENTPAGSYIPYDFAATAAKVAAAPVGQGYNAALDTADEMFRARADNTLIGNMRDCGECHVGGGGMEYFPRNETWDGTAAGGRVPYRGTAQNTAEYTSFNYFIDVFDDDNDGDFNEPLFNDFTKTGVIEMDCLQCHMTSYSWEAAKAAKREGRFDASRAAGAGFGTASTLPWNADNTMPAGFGTHVDYDESKLTLIDTCSDYAALHYGCTQGIDFAYSVNISTLLESVPPAENCASCHQGKYQVDWKKRGEMSSDADVHARLGCMACHERKDDINMGSVFAPSANVGTSLNIRDGKLGHDPAKGGAGQWDSLNNKNDWKEFKTCNDCHAGAAADLGTRGKNFGAPNAAAAHAAAGLTATIVQKKGNRSGDADGSHLDIISCEACHITKQDAVPHQMTDHNGNIVNLDYATGGCFVDGSGPDHEGRLATHDTYEVSRPMFTDAGGSNFGYTWAKDGKIHGGNMLTSIFFRDKNDVKYDVNTDGRAHGMDAILPTHMLALADAAVDAGDIEHANEFAILADGVSDDTEVAAMLTTLNTGLQALNGAPGTQVSKIKMSWVTVPFTMSHQIDAAANAFGAGGCTDCHGASPKNGGFYKGNIDMNGFASFGFNGATQTTPMTKVQGGTEKTFGHPNMKDKFGFISIPLMNNNGPAAGSATNTIRDMDRSEGLYEVTFRTRDGAFKDTITGGNMVGTSMVPSSGLGTTWKGWLLKLEVCDEVADPTCATYAKRSMMIGPSSGAAYANIDDTPSITELLAVMPANFKNDAFGFSVTDGGAGNIVITTDATHKIRVSPQSNYGAFKIPNDVLIAAPITPVVKSLAGWDTDADDLIDGRAEMIAYLDAVATYVSGGDGVVSEEDLAGTLGIGGEPIADIASINGVTATSSFVTTGDITVVADTANEVAGSLYAWRIYKDNVNDPLTAVGATPAAITLPAAGTYSVELRVTSVDGVVATDMYHVVALDEERNTGNITFTDGVSPTGDSVALTAPSTNVAGGVYDAIRVFWGDGDVEIFSVANGGLADVDVDGYADVTASLVLNKTVPYSVAGDYTVSIMFYDTTVAPNYNVDRWAQDVTVTLP